MTKRHYIATVQVLVELDDSIPGMDNCQASACDAIAEWMREANDFKDWEYAYTKQGYAHPVEVTLPEDEYEEGSFNSLIPAAYQCK